MNYELEVVDLPNNQSARVYHLYLPTYHYMKQHFHHNVELVYVIKGGFIAHVGKNEYIVHSDDLFLVNTNEVHYFEMLEESEMITVLLSYETLRSYENDIDKIYFDLNKATKKHDELKEKIMKMDAYRKSSQSYKQIKVQEYLASISYLLLHDFQCQRQESIFSSQQLEKIQPILDYIENHYHEDLTIDRLSTIFHYSPSYLCRYFKKMCDMSLFQYIKLIRLNHAFIDVCQTHDRISDIALKHGFADSKAFIKAFKEKYKQTPQAYRKAIGQ